MARSPKEAIVIVMDVGEPAAMDLDASGTSFLDKSRACVSLILQRKVFSESKDEVGLVLMGTDGTINSLNYEHISVASNLQLVSWELIEAVEHKTKPSKVTADWLDAIVVALDFLRQQAEGKKFTEWKLVLLSNLAKASDLDQVDIIINNLKDLQVNFIIIGPELSHTGSSLSKQSMKRIITEVDGVMSNFDDALHQLMFYQNKSVRPMPWNVDLDIGSTIKIPVSGYKKVSSTSLPTWKTAVSTDPSVSLHKESSYFKDDEMQTEVARSSIINGYLFGSTIVPMGDVDEAAMGYKSGPKAFSVLGFTARANIQRHFLIGDCTHYFVARKGNQAAAEALSALIQALHQLDMVAVVRKVYNNNNAPTMGVLFPKIRISSQVLVFAQLPFFEDMREFIFPSLHPNKKDSEEKKIAMNQLIDAMFLEGDMLRPKELADPHRQHWFSCLAHRVLQPGEPLPSIAPHLADMLCSPLQSHEKLADTLAEELGRLFSLEVLAPRQARRAAHSVFKQNAESVGGLESQVEGEVKPLLDQLARDVVEVGTLSPADDFLVLIKRGEPFPTVCEQMTAVVEKLVMCSFGSDDYGKAVEAMRVLRIKCCEVNPQPYNEWLPQLSKRLKDYHKTTFLDLIKGDLGPISSEENPSSNISPEEAGRFFQGSASDQRANAMDEIDEEDLFNQM